MLVANKLDLPDADERLELARELFGARFSIQALDAESGHGLEELRTAVVQAPPGTNLILLREGAPVR